MLKSSNFVLNIKCGVMIETVDEVEGINEPLTLKTLEKHLVKTIAGALVIALVSASLTAYGLFYHTQDVVQDLVENKSEMKTDVKTLKENVYEIKTALSNNGIYTNQNKDDIKDLKAKVDNLSAKQEEMYQLLLDMKLHQRK